MAFAEDYVDVATRLVEFREKYPEGSLQPADVSVPFTVKDIGDQTFIVVVAAAYRDREDPRPGIGMAYELFPGRTPYTRGSELQNAETSAWGRAIVAALAADTKKGIASADEVRNRQAEREHEPPAKTPADVARDEVREYCEANGIDPKHVATDFRARLEQDIRHANEDTVRDYLALLQGGILDEKEPA